MLAKITAPSSFTWEELQQMLGLAKPAAVIAIRPRNGTSLMPSASLDQLIQRQCVDGERTAHLLQLMGSLLANGFDLNKSIEQCHEWNQNNQPPLEDEKIETTCVSIYKSDQISHPERYQLLLKNEPLFDLDEGRIDQYLNVAPPLRRWLLKDVMVLGKAGALIAPGGTSKSQWMLQASVSVATGIPLAGHWEIGETGGVLVFFAEDDKEEVHRRLHRIKSRLINDGQGAALVGISKRLFIFSTIGTNTLLTKKRQTGEVEVTVTVDRIAALASLVPDIKLIVIDPASRFRGGEENSNEDATRFVEALEVLAQRTGATVLLAHHANKFSASSGEVSQGASRGASALVDGLRWVMNLSRPTDAQATAMNIPKEALSSFVSATVTKTNYSAFPAPVLLERGPDGYLSAVNAAQARNTVETNAILAVLRVLAMQIRPISARRLEDDYGGVKNTLKMSKQLVRTTLMLAADRHYIEGGERKPLNITQAGADWLKCFPATAADAVRASKNTPRNKTK